MRNSSECDYGAEPSDERPSADLKPAINNLLWMYGDSALTLHEAERRAIQIFELIVEPPHESCFSKLEGK